MKTVSHLYNQIISIENLLIAWEEFVENKKNRVDMRLFGQHLFQNISDLHKDLSNFTYQHASYEKFNIQDPKQRRIHKAIVRDRLLHHAIYRVIYSIFDKSFIYDSFSCRIGKGTHKAVDRLEHFVRKVSKNYIGPCFALKCDVKKFFNSVDHQILSEILERKICDQQTLWLIKEIINSFHSRERERETIGIPIGNLTSQLFANIYLDEFDQFVKHQLKIKYYLRYCDDFIVLCNDRIELERLIPKIADFLQNKLKLELHPNKIIIRKLKQGIDFLGYVVLPHYLVLRTKTRRRMLKRINQANKSSYLGLLKHCQGYGLRCKIKAIKILQ